LTPNDKQYTTEEWKAFLKATGFTMAELARVFGYSNEQSFRASKALPQMKAGILEVYRRAKGVP